MAKEGATTTKSAASLVAGRVDGGKNGIDFDAFDKQAVKLGLLPPLLKDPEISDHPGAVAEYHKSRRDLLKKLLQEQSLVDSDDEAEVANRMDQKLEIAAIEEREHREKSGSGKP